VRAKKKRKNWAGQTEKWEVFIFAENLRKSISAFWVRSRIWKVTTHSSQLEEMITMLDQPNQSDHTIRPEPLAISELRIGSTIRGWLLAIEVQTRMATNGTPYLHLKLRDPRGNEIVARQFDPPRMEALSPQEGKVLLVAGAVEEYRGQLQIKLTRAEVDEAAPLDLFVLGTRRSLVQLEADFQQLMAEVQHPGLVALLRCCFTPEVQARFRRWPAAVRQHGAVVGGLLEHTVNVTLIAKRFSQLYPCNQSLVLTGALLHDIGKLEELDEQVGAKFTLFGRMVGHIVLGMQYVQLQAQQIQDLDEATLQDLLHIILAHHGTPAFGSPVCPATIEALIVHQADTAEAHLTSFLEHCQRTSGPDGWTPYNGAFGGSIRMP